MAVLDKIRYSILFDILAECGRHSEKQHSGFQGRDVGLAGDLGEMKVVWKSSGESKRQGRG